MHTALVNSYLKAGEETRFVEVVFPEHANHHGTLFGGSALSLMGKAAFVAASRRARRTVVMAGTEAVDFRQPVQVGQVVELTATVARVGRTSMTVEVDVIAETLLSGRRELAMRGRFKMIALDATGRPTPIPDTSPLSQDDAS